jgi:hypothetical protein
MSHAVNVPLADKSVTAFCNCHQAGLGALAEAFMSHAVNSIAPVWQRVTSPDRGTAEPAARDADNRTLAIRTLCGVDKFINSLGVAPLHATWLRASLFKVHVLSRSPTHIDVARLYGLGIARVCIQQ